MTKPCGAPMQKQNVKREWSRLKEGAKVAELADAPDLGSGGAIHGGSSPPFRTILIVNHLHANSAFQGPLVDGVGKVSVSSVPLMRSEAAARPRWRLLPRDWPQSRLVRSGRRVFHSECAIR